MAPVRQSKVYWVTPVIMILSLVLATMFALGHHLYYQSLSGQTSPTGYLHIAGQNISRQQFHLSIGNTFAYLVKMFLSLAVTMAYLQAFWCFVQKREKGATLSELDCVYSILSNILGLFHVKAWRTFPVLLLVGAGAWCLSIASLITPATLSVQSILHRNSSMLQVPQFSFNTLNFVGGMQQTAGLNDYSRLYSFNGPSQPVQRIATAVAGVGQILAIAPPAPNTSWTLDVWAPTMECSEVIGSERDEIWANIWSSIGSSYGANCSDSYAYLAWTPCATDPHNSTLTTSLPFALGTENGGSGFCGNDTLSFNMEPLELYVATLPSLASASFMHGFSSGWTTGLNQSVTGDCSMSFPGDQPECTYMCWCPYQSTTDMTKKLTFRPPSDTSNQCPGYKPADFFQDTSLTNCKFFNTSLSLDFAYPDGLQHVKVRQRSGSSVPIIATAYDVAGPAYPNIPSSYPGNDSNCSVLAPTSMPSSFKASFEANQFGYPNCTFYTSISRMLSYQGIISAFNSLILGYGSFQESSLSGLDISVLRTILADTEELAFLQGGDQVSTSDSQSDTTDLQIEIMNGTQWAYKGLADPPPRGTRGNLSHALEELFQNFTISLLAEPYLQPNYKSPFAPNRLTNVTSELSLNIYLYAWMTLWLAYGLAILVACIIVAFGLTLMVLHNASYNGNFSTVFRASRAAKISAEVSADDAKAQEPLPKHLAGARVLFSQGKIENDSDADSRAIGRQEKGEDTVVTSRLLSSDDRASSRSTQDIHPRGQEALHELDRHI